MKKIGKKVSLAIVFLLVLTLLPVFGFQMTEAKTKVNVKSVVLTQNFGKKLNLFVGQAYQLKVKVTPSKATNKKVSYSSSDSKIVSVSDSGLVTAVDRGSVQITVKAKDGSGKKAVFTVNSIARVSKVTITKPADQNLVLTKGKTFTIKASVVPSNANNKALSFSSSNKKVVTVNSKGIITAKNSGKATITVKAKDGSGKEDTIKVTVGNPVTGVSVAPATFTGSIGTTYKINPVITPSDASIKTLKYSSSNSNLASVDNQGNVQLKSAGVVTIKVAATDGSGKSATLTLTITTPVKSVTLAETKVTKNVGSTYQMVATVLPSDATNKKLAYSSSDANLATVDENGKVTLKKAGTVTITAATTDGTGVKASVVITIVTPVKSITLADTQVTKEEGSSYQMVATVLPSDATNKKLSFSSSNTTLATVDDNGKVTLKKAGTVVVTAVATDGSGVKASCTITIDPYKLVWQDQFDGSTLNTADWNYELHAPGWVNNELQEYTNSNDNTFVKDGSLVIKPIKTVNADGSTSYTSGRVNTQGKHDFKYGRFEIRAKMPKGQGFLPAIWMMPTNEDIYGQWPKCGEIDIAEVLGNQVDKTYGTLHFGEPHTQKQGSHISTNGDYASGYHVYTCDWEPNEIRFYVDGILYNTVNDWFTKKSGFGEVTYPAPFDQPFYMILNLAVGGTWPGNPDGSTQFDQNAELKVDYVKVYQKDSVNENVQKPVSNITFRNPDANGNYINNGDFSVNESLTDGKDWGFLLAGTGAATADISNNELHINTTDAGNLDYSVQVVQPNLPMEKGYHYKLTFDASAEADRTMITDVSAPDNGYIRYLADTKTALTTTKQSYSYEFDMLNNSDANGRVEFNLGNQGSTAKVTISNVKLVKVGPAVIPPEVKSVLPDGNYVYNGEFQEGTNRLGYWNIDNKCTGAQVAVTNINNIRELKTTVPSGVTGLDQVVVKQDPIAISGGKNYILSFDAYGDSNQAIKTTVAGQEFNTTLTSTKTTYKYNFTTDSALTTAALKFLLGVAGTSYIDNVSIKEAGLIINGDFSSGLTGYEPFADSSVTSDVTWSGATNEAVYDIKNTGDAAWKIQLKQNNVKLENGKWYKITFDAKSSINRDIMYALQPDGNKNGGNWTPYTEQTISLTNSYSTFTRTFQMTAATDPITILSFSMGAVGGTQITTQHQVSIDNIKLEEVTEMVKNGDFADNSNWNSNGPATFADGKVTFDVAAFTGTSREWDSQLKQSGLKLEPGASYDVSFKLKSSVSRTVKFVFMTPTYDWYGGVDAINLDAGVEKTFTTTITVDPSKATSTEIDFVISMGAIGVQKDGDICVDGVLGAHTVEIDDVSIKKK
jgi:Beta-glucanase/Beta-glucan synthetase